MRTVHWISKQPIRTVYIVVWSIYRYTLFIKWFSLYQEMTRYLWQLVEEQQELKAPFWSATTYWFLWAPLNRKFLFRGASKKPVNIKNKIKDPINIASRWAAQDFEFCIWVLCNQFHQLKHALLWTFYIIVQKWMWNEWLTTWRDSHY